MNAIKTWEQIVLNYRKQHLNNGNYWAGEHARWYHAWVQRNADAAKIYPLFRHLVSGRVLEVGAGTGLFTAFLALDALHVDVLEPSVDMLSYIKADLDTQNLTLLPFRIEDYLPCICPNDFTLAAHSLFNVLEIQAVLESLLVNCKNLVVLIGTGEAHSFHQMVRDHFGIQKKNAGPPSCKHLSAVLDDLGLKYHLQQVCTPVSYFYAQKEKLLQELAGSCGLNPSGLTELGDFVQPYIQQNKDEFWYDGQRKQAVFTLKGNL